MSQYSKARRAAELKSYYADKAVKDNIVESWLCVDCGTNTHPGSLSGPEIRLALALGRDVSITHDHRCEVYHVKDHVWARARMRAWNGCLCVGCIERRLGRQLTPKDFAGHDRECWADPPCTDRLLNRRGFASVTIQMEDGPQEFICNIEDAAKVNAHTMIVPHPADLKPTKKRAA
jgi:hypothetical protein